MKQRRRVLVVSKAPHVTEEPRVLRQTRALFEAGWDVTVAGYHGRQPPPDWWNQYICWPNPPAGLSESLKERLVHRFLERLSPLLSASADAHFWIANERWNLFLLRRILQETTNRYDLVVAHDAPLTGPLVRRIATAVGFGRYIVDCHEFTPEQLTESIGWRARVRPVAIALERRCLPEASVVTVVSDFMADYMQRYYSLMMRPVPVRNLPFYKEVSFRPTGTPITLLYHGILHPGQGIEEVLSSVPFWNEGRRLVVRGPISSEYRERLCSLISRLEIGDRVSIEPPVPERDLISEANRTADVGIFVLPGISVQNRHRLPNKFFEYIMAGLAICISDLPDMVEIVRRFDLGEIAANTTPECVAEAVNRLTPDRIDVFKNRSLLAAKELCWEREAPRLVEAYQVAVTDGRV